MGSSLESPAAPGRPRREFQRGAERADPSQLAWCSFCCRPSTEVGALVTGPTGAFICAGCVGTARGFLPGAEPNESALPLPVGGDVEQHLLPSQEEALAEIDEAFASGAQRLLLIGAVGVGKSRILDVLEVRGVGRRALASEDVPALVDEDRLMSAEGERRAAQLARSRFVLAAVGGLMYPRFRIRGAHPVVLPTTAELAEATGGRLPMALLESVERVVAVRPPTEVELRAAARQLLDRLDPPRTLSENLIGALALAALESGRGMHELCSLIRRIPPGAWELGEEER